MRTVKPKSKEYIEKSVIEMIIEIILSITNSSQIRVYLIAREISAGYELHAYKYMVFFFFTNLR